MLAFRIVEHLDVVEHLLPGFGAGFVGLAPYPFALEQVEEALVDGIVVAVSASKETRFEFSISTRTSGFDWFETALTPSANKIMTALLKQNRTVPL